MTYLDFIKRLNEPPFEYEIPLPVEEKGKRKKADVWEGRGSYSGGSSVALYKRWYADPGKWALLLKWEVGGTTGGSCWGGTPEPYVSSSPEPPWTHLDDILEHFCPNITFLQFRQLERHVELTDDGYTDFYGNSTKYAMKVLPLESLYEFLNEKGLLPDE